MEPSPTVDSKIKDYLQVISDVSATCYFFCHIWVGPLALGAFARSIWGKFLTLYKGQNQQRLFARSASLRGMCHHCGGVKVSILRENLQKKNLSDILSKIKNDFSLVHTINLFNFNPVFLPTLSCL